jgi:MFS family permease
MGLIRAMGKPLRDKRFLLFGGFTALMTFALAFLTQFVALYVIERLGAGGSQSQMMLVVGPMFAQLLVLGAWGAAADRMGKRPVLIIAGLGLVPVGLGWMLVGPNCLWLGYLLMAVGAALWTGIEVANLNLVMEMGGGKSRNGNAEPDGGTAYVATNTVITNLAGCLGGLAAGAIAQGLKDWSWQPLAGMKTFTNYDVLFALSGVLRLLAVAAILPFLIEPGAKTVRETLQFLLSKLRPRMSLMPRNLPAIPNVSPAEA